MTSRARSLALAFGLLAAWGLPAAPARGQALSPDVAVGAALPVGGLAAHRGAGPLLRAGLLLGAPERRVRLRLGLEASWLPGAAQSTPASSARGDLRTLGLLATFIVGPRGPGPALYGVVGGGLQRVTIEGHTHPYGNIGGIRAGLGVRAVVAGRQLRAEVTPHRLLSDVGTGSDFGAALYWPISIGLTW